METILKFRGVSLVASRDGRLFARIPYHGLYEVRAGDRIRHALGSYTVTGRESPHKKD